MVTITQLEQDFENLAREDSLFNDYFKHATHQPDQYLDKLEALLLEDYRQLSRVCQDIPENISYFLNRVCCYFINNLGLDRRFRKDLHQILMRLLNILETASDKPEVSTSLNPFFTKAKTIEDEPDTPSAFERLKQATDKYKKLEDDTEPNWKRKQRLGQRLIRYPHLYGFYLGVSEASSNSNFGQTTQVRQTQYVNDYTVNLHRYLRQESLKDNNLDLMGSFVKKGTTPEWENPTHLPKDDLYQSVHYYQKTDHQFKETAHNIITSYQGLSLIECKMSLYNMVIDLFPPQYQKAFVGQKLLLNLQGQEASYNDQAADLALIKTAIDYCFKLLVIDDDKNHFFFIDMISNMGIKKTLDILLQLIHCYPIDPTVRDRKLQKQKMLFALEKRLAILFKNYEDFEENEMQWLIYFLENFNIATALQFDGLDTTGIEIPSQVS